MKQYLLRLTLQALGKARPEIPRGNVRVCLAQDVGGPPLDEGSPTQPAVGQGPVVHETAISAVRNLDYVRDGITEDDLGLRAYGREDEVFHLTADPPRTRAVDEVLQDRVIPLRQQHLGNPDQSGPVASLETCHHVGRLAPVRILTVSGCSSPNFSHTAPRSYALT